MLDTTEALAAACEAADEKLYEIENERSSAEDAVKAASAELETAVAALRRLAAAETTQRAALDRAYAAWAPAYYAAQEGDPVTEIISLSEYGNADYVAV